MINLILVDDNAENSLKNTYKDENGYMYFYSKSNISCLKRRNGVPAKFFLNNPYTEHNIKNYLKINNIPIEFVGPLAPNSIEKMKFKCLLCGEYFMSSWNVIKNGNMCNKCYNIRISNSKKHSIEWIKDEAMKRFDITVIDNVYISNDTPLNFYCNKHRHIIQKKSWGNMISKNRACKICNDEKIKNNRFNKISNRLNKLYENSITLIEIRDSKSPMKLYCNKCKKYFYQYYKHLIHGHGCQNCTKSIGEKKIEMILSEFKINYDTQYKFDDCVDTRALSFDFYIKELNVAIEYNGIQHYKPIDYFGGKKSYDIQIKHDEIKSEYCKKNNIKLIILNYKMTYDEIYNILFAEFKE